MSEDNRPARENETSLSIVLITVAGALLGATLLSIGNLIGVESGTPSVLVFLLVVSVVFLVLSIIIGGRGIIRGPKYRGFRGRFNLQAVFGLLGLISVFSAYAIALVAAPQKGIEKCSHGSAQVPGRIKLNASYTESHDRLRQY